MTGGELSERRFPGFCICTCMPNDVTLPIRLKIVIFVIIKFRYPAAFSKYFMKKIIPLFVYFNYNTNSSEPFYTGSKWSGFIQLSANERYVAYVNRSGTWSDSIWSRSGHGNARIATIVPDVIIRLDFFQWNHVFSSDGNVRLVTIGSDIDHAITRVTEGRRLACGNGEGGRIN